MASDTTGPGSPHYPSYYRPGLWKALAPAYDPLVRLVFSFFGGERRVRRAIVEFADLHPGEQALDVGCGTGSLTVMLGERVGPGGRAVGVDLSAAMIGRASRKTRVPWVSFKMANTESLPFPDGSFDKAFLSFSIHEMPEAARANTLREIGRVLKASGGLFVLEYALPENPLARLLTKAFIRLAEEEPARRMVLQRTLVSEVERAGFAVIRQQLYAAPIQMLSAVKAPSAK
ncbi:MAG: class I SAM-dependent methyltransferase [Chloroflexi bacterium]|nr:class I SAM-dependent methyltransferase [Chloroflexota bacterium]